MIWKPYPLSLKPTQSYTEAPGCNPSDLIIHFFIIISIVFLAPCCFHSHCFGLNMLVTPFPLHHESLPTLLPGSLLEAIWVRHRHCWLKRGFFCHPLREEHWDKRWDETDHKHSSINRLLPQKRPVVRLLFFFLEGGGGGIFSILMQWWIQPLVWS